MAGQKPQFKMYRKPAKGEEINWKEDELAALWRNESDSGKVYWTGKTSKGVAVIMFENKDGVEAEKKQAPHDDADDVPF